MKHISPEPPFIAWRKSKNLKNYLVRAKLPNAPNQSTPDTSKPPGTHRCNKPRCKMCHFIDPNVTFKSSQTNHIYQIQKSGDCTTNNIIYLITCKLCNKQYVGQTQHNLQTRFRNHRFNILHKNSLDSIGNHFSHDQHNINDMSVKIIEQIPYQNIHFRLQRENHWMTKLNTLEPHGLNIRTE